MISKAVTLVFMALNLMALGAFIVLASQHGPENAMAATLSPAVKPPNTSPTAADPAQVVVIGPNSTGIIPIGDPCTFATKTNKAISTAAGTTQLVAPVAGQSVYICSYYNAPSAIAIVSIIEGAGATCTTPAAIFGSTTAASGQSMAANFPVAYGDGQGTIGMTATAGNGVCLLQSGTANLAGNITYVQQ